ncbi:MAG: calcium/sodium antiporter [Sedimentisphaerales bacterium]|nr:calcium/sodium antiporter [Sedimentisphaerales bacterium]
MSLPVAVLLLAVGLIVLWKAADILVSGAVNLANRLGVSPLVIGLTIVAMGTSAPEVAASIAAALRNTGDVAVGNVYGSNIANLALVGGLCALISPISVRLGVLRREMPVMLIVALLLFPILHNLFLSRPEGMILLVIFFAMIAYVVWEGKHEGKHKPHTEVELKDEIEAVKKVRPKPLWLSIVMVIIGLAGLAIGADITLRGAVVIGTRAGLSEAVIGLTIVAVGTSLPELATCLVAAFKKQDDISIGNLVGSNIFNTLFVTGTAGVVRPFEITARLAGADYWIMVVVSFVFMIMAIIGKKISRIDGIILIGMYAGFIVYLLAFTAGA